MSDYSPPRRPRLGSTPDESFFSHWDHWADFIPTPLLVKDLEGRYLACNRAFEELTGIPRERLVGGTVYDLEETTEAALHSEMDCRLLATGEPQVYEAIIRSVHQGVIHAQLEKALLRDAEGNPVGIVGVITDLRAQRKMAREMHLREAAIDSAHSPIAIISLDGALLYVNEAFVAAAQTESPAGSWALMWAIWAWAKKGPTRSSRWSVPGGTGKVSLICQTRRVKSGSGGSMLTWCWKRMARPAA